MHAGGTADGKVGPVPFTLGHPVSLAMGLLSSVFPFCVQIDEFFSTYYLGTAKAVLSVQLLLFIEAKSCLPALFDFLTTCS